MPELSAASILIQLIEDYHSLNSAGIGKCPYPTSLEFSRQVSRGRPCVYEVKDVGFVRSRARQATASLYAEYLKGRSGSERERATIAASPAFSWSAQWLSDKVSEQVEVAVTPDGRADSIYSIRKRRMGGYKYRREDDSVDDNDNSKSMPTIPTSKPSGNTFEQVFLQPASIEMTLSTLLSKLTSTTTTSKSDSTLSSTSSSSCSGPASSSGHTGPVYYLQSQNSNMTTTALSPLYDEIPETIPFATPVLGEPDAVNLWIGDDRSVTTTHRDPYDNLYLVLRGRKTFTLWPPVEEVCLSARLVRTGRFVYLNDSIYYDEEYDDDDHDHDDDGEGENGDSGPFEIQLDVDDEVESDGWGEDDEQMERERQKEKARSSSQYGRIPWIPIDPSLPRSTLEQLYPYYRHARPETVTVEAGEMLYLPAGWFHHVRQQCGQWEDGSRAPCVAVNYWFDMDYEGERYAFHQLITRLVEEVRNSAQGLRPGGMES